MPVTKAVGSFAEAPGQNVVAFVGSELFPMMGVGSIQSSMNSIMTVSALTISESGMETFET
jgi:hypothetical protein